MLQIRNITKIYKSGKEIVTALDNVSLDFPDKGLIFIVGSSGAGKSTLLNILGGLDTPTSGHIYFDGIDTSNFKEKDYDYLRNYKIGFIFQEFNLLEDENVYDNIAISLKIQASNHDITTIDEALKLVNLEGLGYRKISELSGGQKQRIAIARALCKNPEIILADEPTGALDSKTSIELTSSLKNLSENKLIIVVSHDLDLAYHFADQIIFLNDGKIVDFKKRKIKNKEDNITKIGDNILKIFAGNKIDDVATFNNLLTKDSDNFICLTTPENITIANPEKYNEVFKKENYQDEFIKEDLKNEEIINNIVTKKKKSKANLKIKECLKMVLDSYKRNVGRIIFLLLFTIISISLLGTCFALFLTNSNKIIANTLINNDISLGAIKKSDSSEFKDSDLIYLNDKYDDTSFVMSKTLDISFGQAIDANNSSFSMQNFTGIIECNNIETLNLNILEGKGYFDENSLLNNEIIISDYAAYELQRTGYYGNNQDGYYAINKPLNNKDIIGTSILLRNQTYNIIGIFDTNYEKYLSLLVGNTYQEDNDDSTSLEVLKNYYYSKIIAPTGFYKQMYYNNSTKLEKEIYSVYSKTVEVYNSSTNTYALSKKNIAYSNFTDFATFTSNNFTVIYEKSTNYLNNVLNHGGLSNNQIIINSDLLETYGIDITSNEQINRFVETLNTLYISKIDGALNPTSCVYQGEFEVVGIVTFDENTSDQIFFSNEMVNTLESSKFNYDQMFFSLKGNIYSYTKLIKKLNKEYTVINLNGQDALISNEKIESFKQIALIISAIFIIFSFLIILNFVSGNVKARKKEIGILRASGARKKDVMHIFLIEEGFLSLVITILSSIITYYLSNILNSNFGNVDIGIQVIIFDIFVIIAILFITVILIGSATLIPVLQITSLKPIDAIRNN